MLCAQGGEVRVGLEAHTVGHESLGQVDAILRISFGQRKFAERARCGHKDVVHPPLIEVDLTPRSRPAIAAVLEQIIDNQPSVISDGQHERHRFVARLDAPL